MTKAPRGAHLKEPLDWPLVAALLLFAITLAVTTLRSVRAADGHFVYAIDDAYIQMSIGKNLAGHGVWGVTRYEFSGSGSSLIWPLLLAGGQRLFGQHDLFPLVLNTLAAVLLLAIASSILRRHQVAPVLRFAALVLIVVGLPLAVIVLIGMEHTLQSAVALAVAALAARVRVESGAAQRFFIPILTLSALMLALRYDLAAVFAPALIAIARPIGARRTAAVIGCSVAPGLVYAIVAWRHDWPALPTSVLLKQAMRSIDLSTWHGWIDVAGNIAAEQVLSSPPLLVLILLGLVLLFASSGDDRGRVAESSVLLCIFLAASLVHSQFGDMDLWFRYRAYLIALGIVAVTSGFAQAMSRRQDPLRLGEVASGVAIAALVVYPLGRQGYLSQHRAIENAADIYRLPLQAGRFLGKYPPGGAVVVEGPLGVFTYFSDARFLDLEGLANIDVARTLLANPGRDFDLETLQRFSSAHDARVSVGSPPFSTFPEWTCVSQWQDEDQRLVFLAVSPDEAASLEAHLAAFDGELPSAVRREPCALPISVP